MEISSLKIFFCQPINLQNLLTSDSRSSCLQLEVTIHLKEIDSAMNLLSSRTSKRRVLNQIGMPRVWFYLTYVVTIIPNKWMILSLGSFQMFLSSDIKTSWYSHIKWCNFLPKIVFHLNKLSWNSRKCFNLTFLQFFLFLQI